MEFYEKLFELRKASGMSQEEVATELDVSRQTVSKWETGQAAPETDKLPSISELFQVSLDYLLKPSDVDVLSIKTMQLETQQKSILDQQRRTHNRQFLIISSVVGLIAVVLVYMIGRYVMWPDVGEGYTYLGKSIMYGGTLLVIAGTVLINWRHRTKPLNDKKE